MWEGGDREEHVTQSRSINRMHIQLLRQVVNKGRAVSIHDGKVQNNIKMMRDSRCCPDDKMKT